VPAAAASPAATSRPRRRADGTRVAFAHRPAAGGPLSVWIVRIGGGCTQVTPPSGSIHNFDPAWSPDGNYLVFASTRGKSGPTQSKKRNLPQSDLWRVQINPTSDQPMGTPEQMTFLSSSELSPQFMREGRVTMTTEKVGDSFYQLSGRRLNWDLTDYHPLLAQRKLSPYASLTDLTAMPNPSIGFDAATDIREGSDGNFVLILSDVDATGKPVTLGGGGALAIFNRSIGPFEQGRTDPGYLPSVRIVPGATGRDTGSAYRSPVVMPDGQIMASYYDGSTGSLAWRIVSVNVRTGARNVLLAPPGGRAYVDAVLAYKYPPRALYVNRRQLVFGGTTTADDPEHAFVHMPDAPMVFTLLTGNLRRGRPVAAFRGARYLAAEVAGMTGRADLADDGSVKVRVRRRRRSCCRCRTRVAPPSSR